MSRSSFRLLTKLLSFAQCVHEVRLCCRWRGGIDTEAGKRRDCCCDHFYALAGRNIFKVFLFSLRADAHARLEFEHATGAELPSVCEDDRRNITLDKPAPEPVVIDLYPIVDAIKYGWVDHESPRKFEAQRGSKRLYASDILCNHMLPLDRIIVFMRLFSTFIKI